VAEVEEALAQAVAVVLQAVPLTAVLAEMPYGHLL
jgi:hypothetical protein